MSARTELLERQVLDLFLSEGFSTLPLDVVAKRLSCSKATLYAIAPTRDELIRRVIGLYFKTAAARAELSIVEASDPRVAIRAYLRQIAIELRPPSAAFLRDLAEHPLARSVYEINTRLAAARVQDLMGQAQGLGLMRSLQKDFATEIIQSTMTKIHHGDFRPYGISDADAFDYLADLLVQESVG